jgi:signal transduction histidine kinase
MAALGQMAAGITHEIANPLASMDAVLQLLQRKPERTTPQSIETLRGQVARIHQIVRQMTSFAHPDEEFWEVRPLNEVADAALEMLRFDARLKGVTVERQFSPEAGALRLMPQAMQQVLINLIVNALDAMAETPEPRLTIRTERTAEWCVVHVIDNGHGIRPEHINRLFEPFFTTKPIGKGTGVGLSISFGLVQKQGGTIAVASRPGEGATFTIRLPRGLVAASEPTPGNHVSVA